MRNFAYNLKSIRTKSGISQSKLADDLEIARSSISMYERGNRLPSFEVLEAIADYFNVSLSALVGDEYNEIPGTLPVSVRRVPLLGGAACGDPIYAPGDGTEYATVPGEASCDFALIAEGDSMTGDRIQPGDVVFFVRCSDVRDGEIAAVSIDEGMTIKHVRRIRAADGSVLFTQLLSSNPAFAPIDIGGEDETRDVHIIGRAIAFKGNLN